MIQKFLKKGSKGKFQTDTTHNSIHKKKSQCESKSGHLQYELIIKYCTDFIITVLNMQYKEQLPVSKPTSQCYKQVYTAA